VAFDLTVALGKPTAATESPAVNVEIRRGCTAPAEFLTKRYFVKVLLSADSFELGIAARSLLSALSKSVSVPWHNFTIGFFDRSHFCFAKIVKDAVKTGILPF